MQTTILKQPILKTAITLGLAGSLLAGCATTALINKDNKVRTRSTNVMLVEDSVVAFGKPAQSIQGLPADSLVIAGQKNSYILTQGGARFVGLISNLDAKHIQVTKELGFYSAKNDGYFTGTLPLSYVKLKENISKADLEFFIQNGAEECSTSSDERMSAQRFCFNLKLAGVVYPAVSNLGSLKPLSKPYQVSIYTTREESYTAKSGLNPFEKLVLLPFAAAFDVIAIPFIAAEKIFD